MKPIDAIHIGPQKSATTWLFACFREHPQISCAKRHCIHFFDIFYVRGHQWYEKQFQDPQPDTAIIDFTPSYLRSPWAPPRIFMENPQVRLLCCLRHPVERAFSHYWHEKKKKKYNFDFAEILENYDLFSSWLEPGFYAKHLERYLALFPRENLLIQDFDELEKDPVAFLRQAERFLEVDENPVLPPMVWKKVNQAGERQTWAARTLARAARSLDRNGITLRRELDRLVWGRKEYLDGVPTKLYEELMAICEPEIVRLERLLDISLTKWRSRDRTHNSSSDSAGKSYERRVDGNKQ